MTTPNTTGTRSRLPYPPEREPSDTTSSYRKTPNGNASDIIQSLGHPDPRAIAVARAVLEREGPEFTILFGSRARGDWDEESDIDLMLVTGEAPGGRAGR